MQTKNEQPATLSEAQNRTAFWLSIGTGVVMLLILAIFLITGDRELTRLADVRVFVAALALSGFVSAWLTRQGRAIWGITLILIVFYVSVMLTALAIEDAGVAMAAVTLALTFGVTTSVLRSTRMAIYANILAIVLAIGILLLDVFKPFARIANDTPEITWGIAAFLVLAYGVVVLRQFTTYTIRAKLIIAFLLATVIPLAFLAFVNDYNTRAALTNDANQALGSAATQTAVQLDTFMNNGLDIIRTQASLKVVSDYLSLPAGQRAEQRTDIIAFLTNLARQNPVYISSVAIFDIQGIDIADSFTGDVGLDKSDRDYFKKALETGLPYASDIEFSQTTSEASFYFSAPVRNTVGDVIGVIRTRYNANVLQQIISANNNLAGDGSFAVLLDTEHYVRLAHGTTPDLIFKTVVPLDAATVSDLQARRLLPPGTPQELSTDRPDFEQGLVNFATQPYFTADLTNDANIEQVSVAPLKTQNWLVAFAVEQGEFLAPINAQAQTNILLTLGLAVLVAVFGVFISQTLSGPIVRLTQAAEKIAGGDMTAQAKVETGDEIGALASAFNTMTGRLREFIINLEQRVADRTKALATSSAVSRRLSTILDRNELVNEVVHQVTESFGYYHTQIYFYDEPKENLVMAGGTGEAGRKMLSQFHKVAKGRGLVGRAAESNQAVLVSETSKNPEWLPNVLLPDTESEAAIPISIGDQVLGVLDVQHNIPNGLQQEDVDSLQSIANQVAVAIQNIRQYENTQKIAADMSVVAKVGIATSNITDIGRLLQEVVDLSKESFNLYHAHIYLLNETGDTLELAAGAGEVGRQMVAEKRTIPLEREQSLVARAARTREGVVVNDVTLAPDFLPNPLLPDTRSEMAVPMIASGKIIGVLDVQSEQVNRFTAIDVSIKTTLAAQVAGALQNARSFSKAQRQAQREAMVNLITQKIQVTNINELALQMAARELGHALGMKPTLVTLDPSAVAEKGKAVGNE